MDYEIALKNIGDWISKETELRKYPKGELLELSESLQVLKSATARQSVKSEDVAEAIEWHKDCLQYYKDEDKVIRLHYGGDLPSWVNESIKASNISITALQAYEPTTRKDRIVEEVAISKTETTSCELLNHNMNYKKCSSCNHLIHVYVNKPNYCPNCGRKLN